jgi:enoyl-CoA hydratase/carnithine racemase
MAFIRSERDGALAVVTMTCGKANALHAAMLAELYAAVADAVQDQAVRGVVLASGCPKFFSSGFDITEVFHYDRAAMKPFFDQFIDLYELIFHSPKPVVAAVSGHAFAGGAVLAIACDLRVMADGPFGFAFNEINFGVALPVGMTRMLIEAVGVRGAHELLLYGDAIAPAQALAMGLAKELAAPEAVLERALAQARILAEKPAGAFRAIKLGLREAAGHPAASSDHQTLDRFLDLWFSPEAEERKHALIESLRR